MIGGFVRIVTIVAVFCPRGGTIGRAQTKKFRASLIVSLALLVAVGITAPAQGSELDDLRATVQSMQKSMEQMQQRCSRFSPRWSCLVPLPLSFMARL
jgi:hypothetical protein